MLRKKINDYFYERKFMEIECDAKNHIFEAKKDYFDNNYELAKKHLDKASNLIDSYKKLLEIVGKDLSDKLVKGLKKTEFDMETNYKSVLLKNDEQIDKIKLAR